MGGFRLAFGIRLSKKNAAIAIFALIMYGMTMFVWYMIIGVLWAIFGMVYGVYWLIRKSVPFFIKLVKTIKNKQKKEGEQA